MNPEDDKWINWLLWGGEMPTIITPKVRRPKGLKKGAGK